MQNSSQTESLPENELPPAALIPEGLSFSSRMLQLELPAAQSDVQWVAIGDRMPAANEVLLVKHNADGAMGLVGGLHNGREIVVLVFLDLQPNGLPQVMPLIEDGLDRLAGLTHWRAWPTALAPSLAAKLV